MYRILSGIFLIGALAFGLWFTWRGNSPKPQDPNTIREIMIAIVDPQADVVWASVGAIADATGVHEFAPKTPDEWESVRQGALRLADGAEMLKRDGLKSAPPGSKSIVPGVELEPEQIDALIKERPDGFHAFATELKTVAFEAAQAAEARDANSLLEIGGRIQTACENCHGTYWYPDRTLKTSSTFPPGYQDYAK